MIRDIFKERLIIAYGLNSEELEKLNLKFKEACKKPALVITPDMGECTLEEILNDKELNLGLKQLPDEKIVIFNGFKGVYLNQGVKKVREVLGAEPILASTTPNSIKMPLFELVSHLVQERALYKK